MKRSWSSCSVDALARYTLSGTFYEVAIQELQWHIQNAFDKIARNDWVSVVWTLLFVCKDLCTVFESDSKLGALLMYERTRMVAEAGKEQHSVISRGNLRFMYWGIPRCVELTQVSGNTKHLSDILGTENETPTSIRQYRFREVLRIEHDANSKTPKVEAYLLSMRRLWNSMVLFNKNMRGEEVDRAFSLRKCAGPNCQRLVLETRSNKTARKAALVEDLLDRLNSVHCAYWRSLLLDSIIGTSNTPAQPFHHRFCSDMCRRIHSRYAWEKIGGTEQMLLPPTLTDTTQRRVDRIGDELSAALNRNAKWINGAKTDLSFALVRALNIDLALLIVADQVQRTRRSAEEHRVLPGATRMWRPDGLRSQNMLYAIKRISSMYDTYFVGKAFPIIDVKTRPCRFVRRIRAEALFITNRI